MKVIIARISFTFLMVLFGFFVKAQIPSLQQKTLQANPWAESQVIQPASLAAIIKDPQAAKPLIFNIGVVEDIKGAIKLGAASEKENLALLKKKLKDLPANSFIVFYCGCCPFSKCPNVRPAFTMLKDMGFTNAKLLNLETNIKTDWISKGYPLAKDK
ncbi:MAG: hypothetical protein JWN56_147 [Sphingobacteriales bacterium]|nr:hypothetical protein [Sphingobacteriales bacterium]